MFKKTIFLIFILALTISCSSDDSDTNDIIQESLINSLTAPTNGIFNEILEITADTILPGSLKIYFNDIQVSSPTYSGSNNVTFRIPRTLEEINSTLRVEYVSDTIQEVIYNNSFSLRTPSITSLSTNQISFGDTLSIYGENFDDTQFAEVLINETEANVVFSSRDSINVIIPNAIFSQDLTVNVFSQLQEDSNIGNLSLKEPTITSTVNSVQVTENITLIGENLNLSNEYSNVLLNGNVTAEITQIISNEEIVIQVPYGPFKEFEIHSIEYQTAGMSTIYQEPIEITSNFILFTKETISSITKPFRYNNTIYSFAKDLDADFEDPFYLWQLNTDTQLWDKFENISFPDAFSFSHNLTSEGFLYVYLSVDSNNFIKIDLPNESMEFLPDFPGATRYSNVLFPNATEVILGKGNFDALTYYDDLFRFDIATNTWNEISTGSMTFSDNNEYEVVNNITYFTVRNFFGANSSTLKAIMKYDPTNYTFEEDYFICSSCSNEELLLYNNVFYTAFKNGQNFGFRNLDTNIVVFSINGNFSIGGPSRFVTDNTDIFFLGNRSNTSLQTDGLYKLNPNILQ